jgi:ribonuclease P protein component
MPDNARTTGKAPPSFSLPRLAKPDYPVVFEQGQKVYGHTLGMWVAVLPDADRRVGVIVAKKTIRRAVDRNRAKRLLREAFRLSRHRLVEGVSVILLAKAGIIGKTCQDVMGDFKRVCKRAKIWKRGHRNER